MADEELVEHASERPNVRSSIELARGANLFRGHVQRRSPERHRLAARTAAVDHRPRQCELRDAEVEQLDGVEALDAARQKEVVRLDVAMDDAERMRGRQSVTRLEDELDRTRNRCRARFADERAEILALEVLHDDERRALGRGTDFEDVSDVIVLDLGRSARFDREPLRQLGVGQKFRPKKFERDDFVALDALRGHDEGHAPAAERTNHLVFVRNAVAYAERQRFRIPFELGAVVGGSLVGSDACHSVHASNRG
jgi:hypothetical protein